MTDVFHARTAEFAFHRTRLRFDLAHTVFSSAGIDAGSALLLRHLQAYLQTIPSTDSRRVLDLGCGHGTLGSVLQALDPDREVTLVDRDALAVDYTLGNLRRNTPPVNPEQTTVHGSLGYDDLAPGTSFDLIVSNLPGKAGPDVITSLVDDAATVAHPGTIVAFVVVAPLAADVAALLAGDRFTLVDRRGHRSHEVLIARVEVAEAASAGCGGSAFDRGVYDRHSGRFRAGKAVWGARTVTGLDEFDTLSHATRLLHAALRADRAGRDGKARPLVLVDPGQGHRAVVASRSGRELRALVSRDLLALRASARCLSDAGLPVPPLCHATSVDPALTTAGGGATLAIHAGDKVHLPWLVDQIEGHLGVSGEGPGCRELVVTGRASPLGRLEAGALKRHRGRVAFKQDRSGYRAIRYVVGSGDQHGDRR